jgi:hypothetical protein
MPNSDEMLDDLEFERQIRAIENDRELMEFTARQVFEARKDINGVAKKAQSNKKSIGKLKIILAVLITALACTGILEWTDLIHIFGG